MTRLTARFVILALLVVNGAPAQLHVHAYSADAHVEHQHGIAAHHHGARVHAPASGPKLEACDPGDHTIRLSLCSVVTNHPAQALAPALLSTNINLPASLDRPMLRDTRVHGPPDHGIRLLRGPPAQIPA